MMRNRIALVLALAISPFAFSAPVALESERTLVAVMPLVSSDLHTSELAVLTERLRIELARSGRFQVMEQEEMESLFRRVGFQEGSCVSTDCLVRAGQALGVELAIGGTVGKVGRTYTITTRLVSVRTRETLSVIPQDVAGEVDILLTSGIPGIAEKIVATMIRPDTKEAPAPQQGTLREPPAPRRLAIPQTTLEKKEEPPPVQIQTTPPTELAVGKESATELHPTAKTSVPTLEMENPVRIEFVLISGGTFDMGDLFAEGNPDERPVHTVVVSDFLLGKTEVTVGQFRRFVEATGYVTDAEKEGWSLVWTGESWETRSGADWKNPGFAQDDTHPVVCISWSDAVAFCQWAGCRLPTEAEWEYAAREGGKKLRWSGTNQETDANEYAWHSGNSEGTTHPVATKKPNALGLYDMTGNAWEWCSDWYGEGYYAISPPHNPEGPGTGVKKVLRGGSFSNHPQYCRNTYRNCNYLRARNNYFGFRVARSIR